MRLLRRGLRLLLRAPSFDRISAAVNTSRVSAAVIVLPLTVIMPHFFMCMAVPARHPWPCFSSFFPL
jgi:hypothetical protein